MAINDVHTQLKEKLIGETCHNLNEFAFISSYIEQFIHERENKCAS